MTVLSSNDTMKKVYWKAIMNKQLLLLGIICLLILTLGLACQETRIATSIESPSLTPSSATLTILNTVTSRRVSGDYAPLDVTSQFSPADAFYCVIQVANAQPGTPIIARWLFGDALISEASYTTKEQGSGYIAFELTNQQPWPEGIYRVEIISADAVMGSTEFSVIK